MIYPSEIYADYQLIEKKMHGATFYGVVRHFSLFGKTFTVQMRLDSCYFCDITYPPFGKRWVSSKREVEEAMRRDIERRERKFCERVMR